MYLTSDFHWVHKNKWMDCTNAGYLECGQVTVLTWRSDPPTVGLITGVGDVSPTALGRRLGIGDARKIFCLLVRPQEVGPQGGDDTACGARPAGLRARDWATRDANTYLVIQNLRFYPHLLLLPRVRTFTKSMAPHQSKLYIQ